jgi:16S rRNA (guanine(966)-N(2))-methyltransferase RsmD
MRVVAGQYKGRRLAAPRGARTRPTADRVREAVFNLLGPIDGERVLDLYAGSGALGIEALSRGAREATFVESDPNAVLALRQNLELLGIERARVARASVPAYLRGAARRGERWSLVFCDPPYTLAPRVASELDGLLEPVLFERSRVVCESSSRHPLRLELPVAVERRYGNTLVVIHFRTEEPRTDGISERR